MQKQISVMYSRRLLIKKSLLLSSLMQAGVFKTLMAASSSMPAIKIGACDWSIGKSSNIEAFDVAKEIGLDGIMVNMGSPDDDLHIRHKNVQEDYKKAAERTGIIVSSVALGLFNQFPFHSDLRTQDWIKYSIESAKNLNAKIVLLAFFNASDLRNDASRKQVAIQHLKALMPFAEAAGITLGIESYLNAKEQEEIMNAVGSKNLKVYFDFRNTADAGYNPIAEFKQLGKDKVCEFHTKENGFLLEKGSIDWNAVANAVYEMNYTGNGWMHIEGAVPKGADIVSSYKQNLAYLRKLFYK
jgi:sugar phosphate isomerase/epimerase